jgi:hypothetical protein
MDVCRDARLGGVFRNTRFGESPRYCRSSTVPKFVHGTGRRKAQVADQGRPSECDRKESRGYSDHSLDGAAGALAGCQPDPTLRLPRIAHALRKDDRFNLHGPALSVPAMDKDLGPLPGQLKGHNRQQCMTTTAQRRLRRVRGCTAAANATSPPLPARRRGTGHTVQWRQAPCGMSDNAGLGERLSQRYRTHPGHSRVATRQRRLPAHRYVGDPEAHDDRAG